MFADSRINQVLSAIHANPTQNWSVEGMGKLVNVTPPQYVIFVRLEKASRLIG
ncbi:MAG: hypothetical protein AB8B96_01265 [Lysobacterales bacterium]